jgi:adenylate kinase family enzyme
MFIHLLGPSGSGTSILGKAISQRLNIPWFDSDDIFWIKTDPPYTKKRILL